MSDKPARPRYLLELEALPGAVPEANRLRQMLKALLRYYDLRCLRFTPLAPPTPAPSPPVEER